VESRRREVCVGGSVRELQQRKSRDPTLHNRSDDTRRRFSREDR
jgi:hypothetical protein